MKIFAAKSFFKVVSDCLAQSLETLGFRKNKESFIAFHGDFVVLIQLQKSVSSTSDRCKLTLNAGVLFEGLLDGGRRTGGSYRFDDCQVKYRIGDFLDGTPDKWWTLESESDARSACLELRTLLSEQALPALEDVVSVQALIRLWESEEAPGITEVQRIRYLMQLRLIAAENQ